jgi:hypothetical protein
MSKPNPLWTEEFVQFRQGFGLHRFKLHRHLVDVTVKSVRFRQVFSGFGLDRFSVFSGFGLGRFSVFSGFSRCDCKVCLV